MSTSSLFSELPLSFSLLVILFQILGARAQELAVLQTQGPLMLTAGETLSLNCTLIGIGPPGSVRWYKGSDRGQPPIYNDRAPSPSRVSRVFPGSNLDYSIRIRKIQPEDAGTYYCVKYRARFLEMEYKSGDGTKVLVIATPSSPSITGPASRVDSGTSVNFSCFSDGFFPQDITVMWLKDGRTIPASQTLILPLEEHTSYQMKSTVEVPLTEKDVMSELTCQIQHKTLSSPLRQSFKLGDALRVAPEMLVEPGHLLAALVNQPVTITCKAKGFYPNDTRLVWKENLRKMYVGISEPVTKDQDGTFSVKNSMEMNATKPRNHSVFTCYAMRNSQISDHINVMLTVHREEKRDPSGAGHWLLSNPGLWVVFILNKIVAAVFLSFLFLRKVPPKTNRGPTTVATEEMRLRESPVKQQPTNQQF